MHINDRCSPDFVPNSYPTILADQISFHGITSDIWWLERYMYAWNPIWPYAYVILYMDIISGWRILQMHLSKVTSNIPNDIMLVGLRPVIQILCHVLARGWGRWLRYFTEGKAEVKYRASTRIRGPKHDTRFEWPVSILIMTRHPFLPFKTHKTSAK